MYLMILSPAIFAFKLSNVFAYDFILTGLDDSVGNNKWRAIPFTLWSETSYYWKRYIFGIFHF